MDEWTAGTWAAIGAMATPVLAIIGALYHFIRKVNTTATACTALEKRLDESVPQPVSKAIEEAIEGVGSTMERVAREWKDELTRHVNEDSEKHREIFDQNRKLIGDVGELKGLVQGAFGKQQ